MSDAAAFHEEQRFTQPWVWVVVVGVAGAAVVAVVAALVTPPAEAGDWLGLGTVAVVGTGLLALFAAARLDVDVYDDRIVIRFRPLTTRTIRFEDVTDVEAVTYRAVREYGGWGVKGWSRRKVAYNVRGDRGARLTLTDGRTVLVGSRRADELADAIRARLG